MTEPTKLGSLDSKKWLDIEGLQEFHSRELCRKVSHRELIAKSNICSGVLRGLKFCVRTRRSLKNFGRTRPADHPNPRPPPTFSVSNPHLTENY